MYTGSQPCTSSKYSAPFKLEAAIIVLKPRCTGLHKSKDARNTTLGKEEFKNVSVEAL